MMMRNQQCEESLLPVNSCIGAYTHVPPFPPPPPVSLGRRQSTLPICRKESIFFICQEARSDKQDILFLSLNQIVCVCCCSVIVHHNGEWLWLQECRRAGNAGE